MTKAMTLREVTKALKRNGAEVVSDDGSHTKWQCSCGAKHSANLPRHKVVSPGVVSDTIKRMGCLPKGWLQ